MVLRKRGYDAGICYALPSTDARRMVLLERAEALGLDVIHAKEAYGYSILATILPICGTDAILGLVHTAGMLLPKIWYSQRVCCYQVCGREPEPAAAGQENVCGVTTTRPLL